MRKLIEQRAPANSAASVERSVSVAECNFSAQVSLIDRLRRARQIAGRTIEEVAQKLGTEPSMVVSIESGEYELNLTELRHYAYAVDAAVSYHVLPDADRQLRLIRDDLHQMVGSDSHWKITPEWSTEIMDDTNPSVKSWVVSRSAKR